MPVKRRAKKRLTSPEVELAAWAGTFDSGFDFFRDLDDFGLATDDAVSAAAPGAWRRLGVAFLEAWTPKGTRQSPWALEIFGVPPCQ